MNTYYCYVRLLFTGGSRYPTRIVVQASTPFAARAQIEALYGREHVVGNVMLVK